MIFPIYHNIKRTYIALKTNLPSTYRILHFLFSLTTIFSIMNSIHTPCTPSGTQEATGPRRQRAPKFDWSEEKTRWFLTALNSMWNYTTNELKPAQITNLTIALNEKFGVNATQSQVKTKITDMKHYYKKFLELIHPSGRGYFDHEAILRKDEWEDVKKDVRMRPTLKYLQAKEVDGMIHVSFIYFDQMRGIGTEIRRKVLGDHWQEVTCGKADASSGPHPTPEENLDQLVDRNANVEDTEMNDVQSSSARENDNTTGDGTLGELVNRVDETLTITELNARKEAANLRYQAIGQVRNTLEPLSFFKNLSYTEKFSLIYWLIADDRRRCDFIIADPSDQEEFLNQSREEWINFTPQD